MAFFNSGDLFVACLVSVLAKWHCLLSFAVVDDVLVGYTVAEVMGALEGDLHSIDMLDRNLGCIAGFVQFFRGL